MMRVTKTHKIVGGIAAAAVAVGLVAAQSHAESGAGVLSLTGLSITKVDGKACTTTPCTLSAEVGKMFTVNGKLEGYKQGGGYAKPRFTLQRNDGMENYVDVTDLKSTGFDKATGNFGLIGTIAKETSSTKFRILVRAGDFKSYADLDASFGKWFKLADMAPMAYSPERANYNGSFFIGKESYTGPVLKLSSKANTVKWAAAKCTKFKVPAIGLTRDSEKKATAKVYFTSGDVTLPVSKSLTRAVDSIGSTDLAKDATSFGIVISGAKGKGFVGVPGELYCTSKPA